MRLTGAGWSMTPGDKTKTTRLRLVPRVLDPCHESCAGFRPSQQAERLPTPSMLRQWELDWRLGSPTGSLHQSGVLMTLAPLGWTKGCMAVFPDVNQGRRSLVGKASGELGRESRNETTPRIAQLVASWILG